MTHRLSMPQFEDNVFAFTSFAGEQGWDDPYGAVGECGAATGTFTDASRGLGGVVGMPHTGTHTTSGEFRGYTGETPGIGDSEGPTASLVLPQHWEHAANVVNTEEGLYVVDWTAKQYHEDADFPHVVSVDEFKQNWEKSGVLGEM